MVSGSLVECRNGDLRGEGALQVASVRADWDSLSGIRFDHQVCQFSEGAIFQFAALHRSLSVVPEFSPLTG